ncbi:MAG: PIG-L family deacetylase [Planctomycetes bacterium]|nr:PIG-L family deacetylase [Planctomycetota bacterium]
MTNHPFTPSIGRFEWLGAPRARLALLIVAPHPDDEVIGPGGRACLEAGEGVGAIVVTDGARGAGGRSEPGLAARREEEALAGLRAVHASFGWLLRLPSSALQADPAGAAASAIAAAIAAFAPRVVVTTSPYERHPTHLATTRATLAAVRRSTPRPHLEGFPVWDPVPGHAGVREVEVGRVLEQKLAAVRCHASQCADRPFAEASRAQMERDGTLSELTGSGGTRFVERYLDLDELAAPGAPTLRHWLTRRFEADLDLRLGAGRTD